MLLKHIDIITGGILCHKAVIINCVDVLVPLCYLQYDSGLSSVLKS